MKDKGDRAFFGGFVRGPTIQSDPPQMGSGHFASEGSGKAAYINSIRIVDNTNKLVTPASQAITTREKCYTLNNYGQDEGGVHMYFGGPGGCT